jgi:tetratricopeptide (TPR) repeat protein
MHPVKIVPQPIPTRMLSIFRLSLLGAVVALLLLLAPGEGVAQTDDSFSLNTTTTTLGSKAPSPAPGSGQYKYMEILHLEGQGHYDEALAKANDAVQAAPKDVAPYIIRGHLYSEMSNWDKADADFQTVLQIDPNNFGAQFNRCEVKLMKKDYDAARAGYLALDKNTEWGDLADYKVFVCDLLGGHAAVAKSEFDAFNQAGSHPSYYYANATWNFYNKQPKDAQSWLTSAANIYPAKIIHFYSATLEALGYIKPPPAEVEVP